MKLKFLADVNIEKPIIDFLRFSGYDVKWIPDYDCQMRDDELLALAEAEKRILLTNDKDFGEFAHLQRRVGAGIILFRTHEFTSKKKLLLLRKLLTEHEGKLFQRFVVISRRAFRITSMGELK